MTDAWGLGTATVAQTRQLYAHKHTTVGESLWALATNDWDSRHKKRETRELVHNKHDMPGAAPIPASHEMVS